MFALPILTVAPSLNSFTAGVFPVVEGAVFGWLLSVALIVSVIAVWRAVTPTVVTAPTGRATRPHRPITIAAIPADEPHKIAA